MFPENPEFPLIHTRRYEVRAFRMAADRLMLRGVVVDEKPAGLYLKGDEQPLWLHHMIVDLEIVYPTFLIEKASATFHEHPHLECTHITDHYKKLEGMSIARGFNAKVKELFAGHAVARISLRCCRQWRQLLFRLAVQCALLLHRLKCQMLLK